MAKKGDTPPMSVWVGREVETLKGVVRESPPSLIPPFNFWDLVNADWEGGRIKDRPGQAKVNSGGAMSAAVQFMVDTRDVGAAT